MSHDYRYISQIKNHRWRAQVKQHNVAGTYRTAEDAATAADRYIINVLEPTNGIATIGTIKLNFPDKWPTVEQRAVAYLQKAGFIDDGRVLLAPEFPDDLPEPEEVPYESVWVDEPEIDFAKMKEIAAWVQDIGRDKLWGEYWYDTPNQEAYPDFDTFWHMSRQGNIDPRERLE